MCIFVCACLHSQKYVVSFNISTWTFLFIFVLGQSKNFTESKASSLTQEENYCGILGKSEEAALVQFIALFGELKKGEWPTFGAQHDYWEKAANFIQETARTNYKRSSKCSALHFLYSVKYICSYVINYIKLCCMVWVLKIIWLLSNILFSRTGSSAQFFYPAEM